MINNLSTTPPATPSLNKGARPKNLQKIARQETEKKMHGATSHTDTEYPCSSSQKPEISIKARASKATNKGVITREELYQEIIKLAGIPDSRLPRNYPKKHATDLIQFIPYNRSLIDKLYEKLVAFRRQARLADLPDTNYGLKAPIEQLVTSIFPELSWISFDRLIPYRCIFEDDDIVKVHQPVRTEELKNTLVTYTTNNRPIISDDDTVKVHQPLRKEEVKNTLVTYTANNRPIISQASEHGAYDAILNMILHENGLDIKPLRVACEPQYPEYPIRLEHYRHKSMENVINALKQEKFMLTQQRWPSKTSILQKLDRRLQRHGSASNLENHIKTKGLNDVLDVMIEDLGAKTIKQNTMKKTLDFLSRLSEDIKKHGSVIASVYHGPMIIDAITPETVRVRDPYHGWEVDIEIAAFIKYVDTRQPIIVGLRKPCSANKKLHPKKLHPKRS
ncbi:MAG: hypothetical protein PUP46_09270 [Endozoicomonas sp. (ex Botrylloides leachii)]|nr:hypothetical protein [Endozoicomonas sp. (ex Botrylloides leachii)]